MRQLELKTYPDPCLRIKTVPVEIFNQDLEKTLHSMTEIMYVSQGIGLAAPQVGLGISVLVIDVGDKKQIFINPEIIEKSKSKSKMEEGCLSLPGVTVSVPRPEEVKVRAQDENGSIFIKKFENLEAKAVQHEIDHLNGKLIIDYLDPVSYFFAKRKILKFKNKKNNKTCEVICHVGKRNN